VLQCVEVQVLSLDTFAAGVAVCVAVRAALCGAERVAVCVTV